MRTELDILRDDFPFPSELNDSSSLLSSLEARRQAVCEDAEAVLNMLHCVDLTTLSHTDSPTSVRAFVRRVNNFEVNYPGLGNVASVCTYPQYSNLVRHTLKTEAVRRCAVCGSFPSGQGFADVKEIEAKRAVGDGAQELDVVMPLGLLLTGDYREVYAELRRMRTECLTGKMKVILETGELGTAEQIWNASLLAMHGGADFLKTSTGKNCSGATPEAFLVMCEAARAYSSTMGRQVGVKAAGGIHSTAEAAQYYVLAEHVLGGEWLTPKLFRLGASSLANTLLADYCRLSGREDPEKVF